MVSSQDREIILKFVITAIVIGVTWFIHGPPRVLDPTEPQPQTLWEALVNYYNAT
jgi:hypothetical protein